MLPAPEKEETEQEKQRRHDQLEELALLVSPPVRRAFRHECLEVHPEHPSRGTVAVLRSSAPELALPAGVDV